MADSEGITALDVDIMKILLGAIAGRKFGQKEFSLLLHSSFALINPENCNGLGPFHFAV